MIANTEFYQIPINFPDQVHAFVTIIAIQRESKPSTGAQRNDMGDTQRGLRPGYVYCRNQNAAYNAVDPSSRKAVHAPGALLLWGQAALKLARTYYSTSKSDFTKTGTSVTIIFISWGVDLVDTLFL